MQISCVLEKSWLELFCYAILWIRYYSWYTIFREFRGLLQTTNFLCHRKELDRTILLWYSMNLLLFVVYHFSWIPWVASSHEIKNSTNICHLIYLLILVWDPQIYVFTKMQFFLKPRKLVSTTWYEFTVIVFYFCEKLMFYTNDSLWYFSYLLKYLYEFIFIFFTVVFQHWK